MIQNTVRGKHFLAWLLPCVMVTLLCRGEGPSRTARIHFVTGKVEIIARGVKMAPSIGGVLGEGDTIITGPSSGIDLVAGEHTVVRIGEKSRVTLGAILGAGNAEGRFSLGGGSVFVIISKLGKGESFRVVTPTAVYAVRGTVIRARADGEGTAVSVLTGKVEVRPAVEGIEKEGAVVVERGYQAEIPSSKSALIAAGKVPIPVRALGEKETESLVADYMDVKRRVIDAQAPAVRERFSDDAGVIERDRALRMRGDRERALREAMEMKKKAELEEIGRASCRERV